MDTWERLKVGAAFTGVVLLFLGIRGVTGLVFPQTSFVRLGYKVPGVTDSAVDLASLQRSWPAGLTSAGGGRTQLRDYMGNIAKVAVPTGPAGPEETTAAPPPQLDLGTLLAAASVEKGRQTAQVCTSCHTFEQGGPDRVGPNLWGVVGRNVASHKSFTYSSAFAAQTGAWTYARLDTYLTNPQKAVPGNKMPFAGIHNAEDRANVVAFLGTLNASPPPFPKPEKPKTAEAAKRPGAGSGTAGGPAPAATHTASDGAAGEPGKG